MLKVSYRIILNDFELILQICVLWTYGDGECGMVFG